MFVVFKNLAIHFGLRFAQNSPPEHAPEQPSSQALVMDPACRIGAPMDPKTTLILVRDWADQNGLEGITALLDEPAAHAKFAITEEVEQHISTAFADTPERGQAAPAPEIVACHVLDKWPHLQGLLSPHLGAVDLSAVDLGAVIRAAVVVNHLRHRRASAAATEFLALCRHHCDAIMRDDVQALGAAVFTPEISEPTLRDLGERFPPGLAQRIVATLKGLRAPPVSALDRAVADYVADTNVDGGVDAEDNNGNVGKKRGPDTETVRHGRAAKRRAADDPDYVQPRTVPRWTSHEDVALTRAVAVHGTDWDKIHQHKNFPELHGRTVGAMRYRWIVVNRNAP